MRDNRKEEERKGEVAVVAPPPPSRMAEVRAAAAVDEVVVEGWPKWLTDNIPSEVLAGLVPRSADSYDMLDKVHNLCLSHLISILSVMVENKFCTLVFPKCEFYACFMIYG